MSSGGGTCKPTEHDGLTKSGEPDKRVKGQESEAHAANTEELAHGSHHSSKVQSNEDTGESAAQKGGKKGGLATGGNKDDSDEGSAQLGQERYKPTEHGGKTESGEQDKRVKGQESEAHASNTEELAHGSHHAAQMKSKEDPSKSAAQVGGEHSAISYQGTEDSEYKPE